MLVVTHLVLRDFHERMSRYALAGACVVVVAVAGGVFALVPAYVATSAFTAPAIPTESRESAVGAKNADTLLAIVEKNTDAFRAGTELMKSLRDLESEKLIVVSRVSAAAQSVKVHGVAQTRESLLAYVSRLKTVPGIQDVVLPVGDLSGKGGVFPFVVTVQLKLTPRL
jgi:hypothetical protein